MIRNKTDIVNTSIIFYLYFVLFSGLFIKWLGLGITFAYIFQTVLDILPFGFFFFSNPRFSLSDGAVIRKLSYWLIIIAFILFTIIITVVHSGNVISSITNLGVLFRYLPLSFFLSNISSSKKIEKNLKFIFLIILFIGYVEIFFGNSANTFFCPLTANQDLAKRVYADGNIMGPFNTSIEFAFFLVLYYTFVFFKKEIKLNIKYILFTLVVFVALYYSGSIASLLAFIIIFYLRIIHKRIFIRNLLFVLGMAGSILIFYRFNKEIDLFIKISFYSRLGIIFYTLPEFIKEFSVDTFFGMGTDLNVIYQKLMEMPKTPLIFIWDKNAVALADVFWVAIVMYYGILGSFILFSLFYLLYKNCLKIKYFDCNNKDYPSLIKSIFILIMFLAFFNQILVLRAFTLVFWVIIGIIFSKINVGFKPNIKYDYNKV